MDSAGGMMFCEVAVGLMGLGSLALASHALKEGWLGMAWLGGAAALMCGFLMGVHRGQDVALFAVTGAALCLAAMVVVHRRKPRARIASTAATATGAAVGPAGA